MFKKKKNQADKAPGAVATFKPTDISDCTFWIDAADSTAASMVLSGSNITQWKDKSSSALLGTQVTSTKQATLNAAALNGHSTASFSAGNQQTYNFGTTSVLTAGGTYSIFFVGKFTSPGSYPTFLNFSKSSSEAWFIFAGPNDGFGAFSWTGNYNFSYALSGSAYYRVEIGSSGATLGDQTAYLDGVSKSVATSAGVSIQTAHNWIGSFFDSNFYLDGELAEVVVFNRALDASERTQMNDYLLDKWGV